MTEDFLQAFIYIQVATTHYGAKGHVNFTICMAMGQTIAFTFVKMWELLFEKDAGVTVAVDDQPTKPATVDNPLGRRDIRLERLQLARE